MKKNKKKKIFIIPIIVILLVAAACYYVYSSLQPVSVASYEVMVKIENGSSTSKIIKVLKNKNIIRDEYVIKAYVKINNVNGLKAGTYLLNKNMTPKEIFKTLQKGSNLDINEITITFPEGKNMRQIASIIEEKSANSYEDVMNLVSNKEYITSLINEYEFLTDVVLNENIYYPLEGYLSPNTYNFKADASVKDIFKKMLDETNRIYKEDKSFFDNNKYSVHEIITLASIIEGEGVTLEDRKNIAGVFINRLNAGMSLGSDVTTYYAAKIDLGDRDLYKSEINSDNPYNTRSTANAGKLPIGPICNPSKESIDAAVNYTTNDYYYFVADKNMKVYFSKTNDEHVRKVNELKNSGLWYEY